MTRLLISFALTLVVCAMLIPCQMPAQAPVAVTRTADRHFPHGISYEIFVRSFADSNGDGIGDLNGITAKLDYLANLGVGNIWLTPICPSPTYHKYDVTDYYGIDPEYGTLQDFKQLIAEAHKRGIHVIIDMVFNHSSSEHPWFLEAAKDPESPFRDYYVWSADPAEWAKDHAWNWHHASDVNDARSSEELAQAGVAQHRTDPKYFSYFWRKMPDLNYENKKVREEVLRISRWWLTETGVDGFRLDAIRHIYRDEEQHKNVDWWRTFAVELRKVNPNVYIVGEVWDIPEGIAPFYGGVPALFNFSMSRAMISVVNAGKDDTGNLMEQLFTGPEGANGRKSFLSDKGRKLVPTFMAIRKAYMGVSHTPIDATILSNHDQNRSASDLGGDVNKIKTAASLLLTLPGSPYLYYGEELGMLGVKPDENIREPMLWDLGKGDKMRTRWMKPTYSTDMTVLSVAQQQNDLKSVYNHYKKLIALRNSSEVLTFGDLSESGLATPKVIAFERNYQGKTLVVLQNLSDKPQKIEFPSARKVIFGAENKQEGTIAPFGLILLE